MLRIGGFIEKNINILPIMITIKEQFRHIYSKDTV